MRRAPLLLALSALPFGLAIARPLDLPNPGFEQHLDGWSVPSSDQGMSQPSPDAARSGRLGLLVDDRDPASGSSVSSQRFPARAGQAFRLDFRARPVEGDGMGVYLVFADADQKSIAPQNRFTLTLPAGPGPWAEHSLHAIAPDNAAFVSIWLHSYNKAQVTAHLDDFALTEVTPASAAAAMRVRSGQLPEFPKPYPEKAFAALKVRQPDGSVLRTPVEDWAGARQRVARDPQWKTWFAGQQSRLDAWMNRHRDRVEWTAGWWHDFVSPKDGSFLRWTDDVPGEDVDFLASSSDPRVEITPEIHAAWVYGFRGRHMDKIQDAARVFRLTDDARYAEWAADQLDFYADNYRRWPLHRSRGHPARLANQSLDEAVNLTKLVNAARLLSDWTDPARKQAWFDHLFKPQVEEILDKSFLGIHNIAMWHRAASAQVALLHNDADMWKRVVDGEHGLRAQFSRGVTGDYLWYEQSMGYNDYILNATHPLFLFAGLLGKGDTLRHEAAVAQNLMLAPLAIRFPDHSVPNPADSGRPARVPTDWLQRTYRVMPTTLGLRHAADTRSWDTLVDPPAAIAGSTELPPVVSRHLESSRFALLKKGPWQVFFHYGQLNRSHSQSEALNWSASFGSTVVTLDPGTVGYGSPLHTGYYRRGLNHNVPLIDGRGQEPWHPGELTRFDPDLGVMTGAPPAYRPDATARRTLRIDGDRLIDETAITHTGASPDGATLGLALHLQGVVRLPADFRPVADFARGRDEAFTHWRDVRAAAFENEAVLDVEFPDGLVLRVRFATPGKFTLFQGSSPDQPPARRAGFYLEKTDRAKEATFTTELAPAPSN